MKTIILLLFLANILVAQGDFMNDLNPEIKRVKEKYVEDTRLALFNVEIKNQDDSFLLSGETNIKEAKLELLKIFSEKNISFIDSIKILPDTELGAKTYGIINVSVANLRSVPKHSGELATQALMGNVVNVLKKDGSWYLIQTPDKYLCWAEPSHLKLVSENEKNEWIKSERVIVKDDYSYVLEEKGFSSNPVCDLVAGDILKLIKKEEDFYEVELPDGRRGFVKANSVAIFSQWLDTVKPTPQSILSTARRFMGVPYLWGGTSPKMMDCSGFTKTVFYLNGIYLNRDADQQARQGEKIDFTDLDNLKEGDLLFFGRHATDSTKQKITHVGIYIGNGKYIHESGFIRINSLIESDKDFSKERKESLLDAVRILGNEEQYLIKNNKFFYGE